MDNVPFTVLVVEEPCALGQQICGWMREWFTAQYPGLELTCYHVTTLREALQVLQATPMDLLICDVVLPDSYDGERVEAFAVAAMDIPTVLISGWDCPEKRGKALIKALFQGESYPFVSSAADDFRPRLHQAIEHLWQSLHGFSG